MSEIYINLVKNAAVIGFKKRLKVNPKDTIQTVI